MTYVVNYVLNPDLTVNTERWFPETSAATITATPDGGQLFAANSSAVTYKAIYPLTLPPGNYVVRGLKVRQNQASAATFSIGIWDDTADVFMGGTTAVPTPVLGQWYVMPDKAFTVPESSLGQRVMISSSIITGNVYDFTVTGVNIYNPDTTSALKLEVEQDPTGLVNLIENPSGAQGGYGWITPVAGSVLVGTTDAYTGYQKGLKYTTAADAGGNYFLSEPLPVAASQYVAASWHVNYTPSSAGSPTHRARIDWLNSSKVLLSSSIWTTSSASNGNQNLATVQAPASTAYAQIRFEVANTSHVFPHTTAGSFFSVREVTVAKSAVSSDLGAFRSNLCANPSFETNATGWSITNASDGSIARSTSAFQVGAACLALTSNGSNVLIGAQTASGLSGIPVTPGTYNLSWYARTATSVASRDSYGAVYWYKSNGTASTTPSSHIFGQTLSTTFLRISGNVTAPADAAYARLVIYGSKPAGSNLTNGEAFHVDAVLFERTSTVGAYFDGATTDAPPITYDWTGTAHASASTSSSTNLAYIEPVPYLDILGPTHEIKIDREALNVGTLQATVLDAALDPAVADSLRPGRRVRLLAFNAYTGRYESIFTGKALNLAVEYDETRTDATSARITLDAVDGIQTLASATRPDGVAFTGHLPYVLEGAGVAWNVNGSGNQVPVANVVSRNESATALDQVAITRDSNLGYAWVDRDNVLQAWDAALMSGANLVPNPSFDTNTTNWQTNNCTATRVTSTFASSPAACQMVATAAGSMFLNQNQDSIPFSVTPGHTYVASAWTRALGPAFRGVGVSVRWYDATGSAIGFTPATSPATTNSVAWTKIPDFRFTAPLNAAKAAISFRVENANINEVHFVDDLSVREMAYLDEATYSDLQMSFDSDTCINSVLVKFLRYNAASGETEEVIYGPYEDAASISEWGLHRREFTIHDDTESSAAIQTYAESILTANAVPVVGVNSVTLPIKDATWLTDERAFLDLYDLVTVLNDARDIERIERVTGISHEITPDKWLTTLTFTKDGAVASPVVTPPVQANDATDGTWITPTLTNSWVNYDGVGGHANAAYMRKNGVVYIKGLVKSGTDNTAILTLPAGYRPAETLIFACLGAQVNETTGAASAGTAHTHPIPIGQTAYRVDINPTGTVIKAMSTGTNTFLSLTGISFVAEQ